MTIRNIRTMSDATLAIRTIEAYRAQAAAKAAYDEFATEVRARTTFGTVDTSDGKVTLSEPSERKAFDVDEGKRLIPTWETTCVKVTHPAPSVRVTLK